MECLEIFFNTWGSFTFRLHFPLFCRDIVEWVRESAAWRAVLVTLRQVAFSLWRAVLVTPQQVAFSLWRAVLVTPRQVTFSLWRAVFVTPRWRVNACTIMVDEWWSMMLLNSVYAEQFLLEFKCKLLTLHAPILELAEGYFLSTYSFNFTHIHRVRKRLYPFLYFFF